MGPIRMSAMTRRPVTSLLDSKPWFGVLLLIALCAVITIIETVYVGDATVYSAELADRRATLHDRILDNEPPAIGWKADGTNGINTRVLTVFLVQGVADVTGLDPLRLYKALDAASMFFMLLLLYFFLRTWVEPVYAVLGVMYWGVVLPLTYAFHAFHPWDRISSLVWLLSAWAIVADRRLAFAALLAVGTTIKYDIIVLSGLYFLTWATRANFIAVTARFALFLAIGVAVYTGLLVMRPGGVGEGDMWALMARNVRVFFESPFTHAPLLGFGLLVPLCILGVPHASRFPLAAAAFGASLFIPFFALSNFEEFRAHTGVLLLVLPLALIGARAVLGSSSVSAERSSVAN